MVHSAFAQFTSFEDLQPAAGYFGVVDWEGDDFVVNGWMHTPFTNEFDTFVLYLNRRLVGVAAPEMAAVESDETAHRAGHRLFSFHLAKTKDVQDFSRVEVVGFAGDLPLRRLTTCFRRDLDTHVPTPPEHLMYRVTGNRNGKVVKEAGLRCMSNFLDALGRYRDLSSVRSLLDWGCGCGRVTVHLMDSLSRYEHLQIQGCDIDGEAITWCNEHLPAGNFQHVDPYPPLPWPDDSFDVVVSCSVFTHLSEELQQVWLQEIKRIMTPGGIFLASINSHFPGSDVPAPGISDETLDTMMDGIAPAGYYRGTVQSKTYTNGSWSNAFDILAFIENGIEGVQDLLVMSKPYAAG